MSSDNSVVTTISRLPWDVIQLLDETVYVASRTGVNSNAEPVYSSPPVPIRCRIQDLIREARTVDGLTRFSSSLIVTDGVRGIQPDDQLTMPSGNTSIVLEVNTQWDSDGPLYEEILT